eukprot:gb/GECH01000655.1/.p1 GENE.gb/GECH01000655.1/~~gb/GECH01000655.1/.p1  ORF type:complete len:124 (+),score=17.56 gb/GECH01000655.1/:1-372(+)
MQPPENVLQGEENNVSYHHKLIAWSTATQGVNMAFNNSQYNQPKINYKDLANQVKTELESVFGGSWCVICGWQRSLDGSGTNFGFYLPYLRFMSFVIKNQQYDGHDLCFHIAQIHIANTKPSK